jgi:hypothetical protein
MKKCIDAIALAESCILTCVAGAYPDKAPEENTTVVMTVVASIALSGLKVAEFKAVEGAFKSSLAITLSCSIDQINITNVTEVSDRRLLSDTTLPSGLPLGQHGHVYQRQLKERGRFLNVEFEVAVASANDLKTTTSSLQGRILCISSKTHVKKHLDRSNKWLNIVGRRFGCFWGYQGRIGR